MAHGTFRAGHLCGAYAHRADAANQFPISLLPKNRIVATACAEDKG